MRFKRWLPAILWMGVIFVFSTDLFSFSQTASVIEGLIHQVFPSFSDEVVHFLHMSIRKCGHITEYFILGIAYMYALPGKKSWVIGLVIAYALTDEWHQSFSAVRTASLIDVGWDTFGGILSLAWKNRVKAE